jgi:hypothetical protein
MRELLKLVLRFVAKEIDYDAFREAMVTGYLSRQSGNAALDNIAVRIDVVCADFSQGLIATDDIGLYISAAVQNNAPGANVGSGANARVGQLSNAPERAATISKGSSILTSFAAAA